jgi:hypothetical protein
MATIRDLLKAGFVNNGTELVWMRKKSKETHTAVIDAKGFIVTGDGKIHKTPSGAAKHLNGNKPIDGWNAWKLKTTNEPLSNLRNKLI